MLWRGVCKGYNAGAMWFWPSPELGRSGSPMFCYLDAGHPAVVGIISPRDTRSLGPDTIGRAVSVQQLRGTVDTSLPISQVWTPAQCPGGVCPAPLAATDHYYISPYRSQQQRRDQQQNQRIGQLEQSPGTLPLPTQPAAPPVDLRPLEQRVTALEMEAGQAKAERAELVRRADLVRDTAKELAEKYDPRLKGISQDVNAAIAASSQAAKASGTAASIADSAKSQASEASDKANSAAGAAAENAKGLAGIKAKLDDFIVNGGGPVKQKLQQFNEENLGMGPVQAALLAGFGVVAIVSLLVGIAALFVRKEEKAAKAGEPILADKLNLPHADDIRSLLVKLSDKHDALSEKLHEIKGTAETAAKTAATVAAAAGKVAT